MAFDDNYRELAADELSNANTDRSVNPAVMVRGMMTKTSAGSWVYLGSDANYLRISAVGVTTTTAPLSADSSSISAVQADAGLLRVSALGTFTSTPQNDTVSTAQISAAGNSHIVPVSSGQNTIALFLSGFGTGQVDFAVTLDGTNYVPHDFVNSQTGQIVNAAAADGLFFAGVAGFKQVRLSASSWTSGIVSATAEIATGTQGVHLESAIPNGTNNIGIVSAKSPDAGAFHVSSFIDSGSVSAKSGDANQLHVSAVQGDAGLLRVSSILDSGSVSAKSPDANQFHVSAFVDSGSVSAKSGDANQLHTSAVQGDAGLFHVSSFVDSGSISAKSALAAQFLVSASQGDAGQLRVSAVTGDANNQHVSAVQGDAGLMHVSSLNGDAGTLRTSAFLGVDTTGALTAFRSLSVSAGQNVKAAAGTLYGYYAWNSDTKFNYIKLMNLSSTASLAIGTSDVFVNHISLPPSAAANVEFPHGIKGFTTGITVYATSAVADAATNYPNASAVGITLFYN